MMIVRRNKECQKEQEKKKNEEKAKKKKKKEKRKAKEKKGIKKRKTVNLSTNLFPFQFETFIPEGYKFVFLVLSQKLNRLVGNY